MLSLSFQVQPFVLPKAALYFSFCASYYVPSYAADFTFQTSTRQFRELSAASPYVGSYTLTLPHYNDCDRVQDTLPPTKGDTFQLQIPIHFPCVMSETNIQITLPDFSSSFFTNMDSIAIDTPSNFFSVQSLCDYRIIESFDADMCYTDRLANSVSSRTNTSFNTNTDMRVDSVNISFGATWRSVTVGDACTGLAPDPTCICEREISNITLTGTILTENSCGNRMLADYLTIDFDYVFDVTTWMSDDVELRNSDPQITRNDAVNSTLFAIYTGSLAIDLPISGSLEGDAGDTFNITLGILHNDDYSRFTAYQLNYTLKIDPHLMPEESVTICSFNNSSEPYFCEHVPLVNNMIIRNGYHDV